MAHPRGFEPLASAFGGQRSIQLSYGCVAVPLAARRRAGKRGPWTGPLIKRSSTYQNAPSHLRKDMFVAARESED